MNKIQDISSFLNEVYSQGIELSVKNDNLLISAPDNGISSSLLEEMKSNKAEILNYLQTVVPHNIASQFYHLSYQQLRLWMIDKIEGKSPAYNTSYIMILEDKIDTEVLKKALLSLVERHEILRTVFVTQNDIPYQKVLSGDEIEFELGYYDLTNAENYKEELHNIIQEGYNSTFDLKDGPLFVPRLFKIKNDFFIFCITLHHIITDAWSQKIFKRDLEELYAHHRANKEIQLPVLRKQYKEYAQQIRNIYDHKNSRATEDRSFWKNYLAEQPDRINLISNINRPYASSPDKGRSLKIHFSKEQTLKINQFCTTNRITGFMFFISGLMILLNKVQDKNNFLIGLSISNRNDVDLENLIGFFVNTVVIKNFVKDNQSFAEICSTVRKTMFQIFEHQNYPFDKLISELDFKREINRNPLFDVMTSYSKENSIAGKILLEEEITFTPKFDIDFDITEYADQIDVLLKYNSMIYSEEIAQQLLNDYSKIIHYFLERPDQTLDQVNIDFKNQIFHHDTEIYIEKGYDIVPSYEEENNEIYNAIKDKIEVLFKEILRLGSLNDTDDFFSLGGHSLLGITLISKIKTEFEIDLNYNSIFLYPSVKALANYVFFYKNIGNSNEEEEEYSVLDI